MNTHDQIRKMLVDFALGELSEQKSSEVGTHLAECPQCKTKLKELEAVLECAASMRELSADKQICESAKQMLLDAAADEQKKQPEPRPGSPLVFVWRTIMKSRMTKLSSAAVIIMAIIFGILHFGTSIDRGSILLAEVIRNIEQTGSATWQEKRIFTCDGKEISCLSSDALWYYSSRYGARQDMYDTEGLLLHQAYWLPEKNARIRVVPPMMHYESTELTEAERMAWGQPDVKAIVDLIQSAQPTQLGRTEINGRQAEGFEFTDPASDVCFAILNSPMAAVSPITFESGVSRFWIDVETALPVRYEAELLTQDKLVTALTGGRPVHISITGYGPKWGIDVEGSIFEPDVPADYAQIEWWPAGTYPAHDVPGQDIRDFGGTHEWLRQNQLSPRHYSFFYTNRRGHCIKLRNPFLTDVKVFKFQGESRDLQDLHDKLGTWFVGTPVAAEAYYTVLDTEKAEQIFQYVESSDVLTLVGESKLVVRNGCKHLIRISDFGSAVMRPVQKYAEQIIDLSFSVFPDGQETVDIASARAAAADIPSVKMSPEEAVLVKFSDTTLPAGQDGTDAKVLILIRMTTEATE